MASWLVGVEQGVQRGGGARGAAGRVPGLHPPRGAPVPARGARPRPVPGARARRRHYQPAGLRAVRTTRWTR